jgi:hypothetical protein
MALFVLVKDNCFFTGSIFVHGHIGVIGQKRVAFKKNVFSHHSVTKKCLKKL